MADQGTNEVTKAAQSEGGRVVALFCSDLMFLVQLQNMVKKAGHHSISVRPGAPMPQADLLVVDLSSRGGVEAAIRAGVEAGIPVVGFGPHMDAAGRRAAKEAGAGRVLANSNLSRDLPKILEALGTNAS